MQVTDELRVLVEAEVARAIENFKKLDTSIDGAEQKTESLGDALDSISKKSLILSGVIGGAGIAAVKFAGENEKLKLSLKNMLGSAEEASAVFEDWRRLGTSPGLSVDEVFTLGRAMVNMGHDTEYATRTIQMLGDVAAGTGGSFGAVSGSFERVRATGKLTTRDLAGLQQQGIPVLKQLAKELNTSEDGVRCLAAEGKLGFSDLERALKGMTAPGGQFAGMMDELSGTTLEKFKTATADSKQALASFGETMLPMATELLDGASSILRGITDMDEGTKRLVIGMGGMVAVSGPVISAMKGINVAMAAVAANPYIAIIGGVVAAAGIVASIVNKQANAYQDLNTEIRKTKNEADNLLRSYAGGNDAKILDKQTTEELIRLYPQLTGVIKANAMTVEEAARAVAMLAHKQREDLEFKIRAPGIERLQGELSKLMMSISDVQTSIAEGYSSGEALDQLKKELAEMEEQQREYVRRIFALNKEALDAAGTAPTVVFKPDVLLDPEDTKKLQKTWQDWYGEITKIDPAQFGDSGAEAAELYLTEFSRSFEAGKTVFAQLGEEFNIAETLRSQQADIQKALVELFSINPADIDQPFEAASEPVRQLIEEYRRLGVEAKAAEAATKAAADQEEAKKAIEDLRKKIDDLGKSEGQLAYGTALANGALPKQAEEIRKLTDEFRRMETLAEYNRQIDEIGKSQKELAMAAYEAAGATEAEIAAFKATLDLRDELLQAEQLKETIKGLGESLRDLGFSSAVTGAEELGRAFGEGRDAMRSMRDALVAMHQEILNALPNLFLQAGLQLIGQGQWALGLGFIAAAGSMALVKGYVNGRIEAEQSSAQANAHGNIFDAAGIQAFARGGTFTNQVVQNPTFFKFARGTGLMGEAGPEAIMPLTRMPNGDLGVQTAGGGAQVTVNIINNSGAEVRQEERDDGTGGKQIDITIGEIVGAQIAQGRHNSALESQFEGLRRRGR